MLGDDDESRVEHEETRDGCKSINNNDNTEIEIEDRKIKNSKMLHADQQEGIIEIHKELKCLECECSMHHVKFKIANE